MIFLVSQIPAYLLNMKMYFFYSELCSYISCKYLPIKIPAMMSADKLPFPPADSLFPPTDPPFPPADPPCPPAD